jgi:hypothetical protein
VDLPTSADRVAVGRELQSCLRVEVEIRRGEAEPPLSEAHSGTYQHKSPIPARHPVDQRLDLFCLRGAQALMPR